MKPRLIAAIGGGGKSTSLTCLADALADLRILYTTTTHIFPLPQEHCRTVLVDPEPAILLEEMAKSGVLCTGTTAKEGKLGSLSPSLLKAAIQTADVTLYEADGANHLPLKLHRKDEPVVLPDTDRCLVVAGLSALGRPVSEVVHRYQLHPYFKAFPDHPVKAEELIFCILETVKSAGLQQERYRILLNQSDLLSKPSDADSILSALRERGLNCRLGSLRTDSSFLTDWVMSDCC